MRDTRVDFPDDVGNNQDGGRRDPDGEILFVRCAWESFIPMVSSHVKGSRTGRDAAGEALPQQAGHC